MAVRWAITGGSWSNVTTWNDGATLGIPTVGDDVWTNSFTVNMDVNATVNSLNNSARARDIATPQMTSNTSPAPIVLSNISNSSSVFASFNRNYASTDYSNLGATTGWTQVDFGVGNVPVIDGYQLYGADNVGNNIRSWELQGSSDGTNFTILHVYTASTALAVGAVIAFTSIGNTQGYRYYRLNVTANGGSSPARVGDIDLYARFTGPIVAGGSFNFNTAGVSVSCTSVGQGATNFFTITNTGGTVSLSVANNISVVQSQTTFSHSGNGNFTFTTPNLVMANVAGTSIIINKTGAGILTVNSNLLSIQNTQNNLSVYSILSSNGDVIVNGNVFGPLNTGAITNGTYQTIRQTAGNLTINGNLTQSLNLVGNAAVFFQGTTVTLNGNTIGDTGIGILSTGTVNVNGNLFGANAVVPNTTITINVTGNTYASYLGSAINCSSFPNSVVNLTGNMYNTLGRNAIWCPNIFISNSATTLWRMDIGGGLTRTLYSADSFPNLPSTSNVRNLVQYGPASALTGTMVVASPSNIRVGVLTDNTVGTANITAQDIINFINTSSDPLAVRMRTMLTDNSAGQLISEYNFV